MGARFACAPAPVPLHFTTASGVTRSRDRVRQPGIGHPKVPTRNDAGMRPLGRQPGVLTAQRLSAGAAAAPSRRPWRIPRDCIGLPGPTGEARYARRARSAPSRGVQHLSDLSPAPGAGRRDDAMTPPRIRSCWSSPANASGPKAAGPGSSRHAGPGSISTRCGPSATAAAPRCWRAALAGRSGSASRCKAGVRRLHEVCGVAVVPIGRHSMMARFGVPGGGPLALAGQPPPDAQAIARFVDALGRLTGRMAHLAAWAAQAVALNLGERGLAGGGPGAAPALCGGRLRATRGPAAPLRGPRPPLRRAGGPARTCAGDLAALTVPARSTRRGIHADEVRRCARCGETKGPRDFPARGGPVCNPCGLRDYRRAASNTFGLLGERILDVPGGARACRWFDGNFAGWLCAHVHPDRASAAGCPERESLLKL